MSDDPVRRLEHPLDDLPLEYLGGPMTRVLDEAGQGPETLRRLREELSSPLELADELRMLARALVDYGIDPEASRPFAVTREEVRRHLERFPLEISRLPEVGEELSIGGVRAVVVR